MNNPVLRHGLVAGGVLSAMMLATHPFLERIGFSLGTVIGYTTMVVAFLMVYFGARAWRDQRCGGRIGFWRAFGVGMGIVAVATVCYVATWELIYFGLMPDFADQYAAYALDQARQAGATDAQLAATARQMAEFKEMYRNPLINIAFTVLEPLPVGLLFALGSAGLLSRQRTPAQ